VGDVSLLKSDHERAEFRQAQPLRHLALEHSSLTRPSAPFSGDDKDEPRIARPRRMQEPQKYRVRLALG
jgi:hypothetical protein